MKKVQLLSFFCFFIFVFYERSYPLIITPEFIEFGKVKKFYQSKRYILFENNSQEKVEILGVVNACGIALNIEKKYLKPGEMTEGELIFDAGTPQGNFLEKITIAYKEGNIIRENKITVAWYTYPDRYPEIYIDKKNIDLGYVLPKSPVPFEFEVSNFGNMTLTINTVIKEGLLINLPIDINPGETKIVRGSLTVEKEEKSFKVLTLETNDLNNPRIDIKLFYEAKWDIPKGLYIDLENVRKFGEEYEIPVRIGSNKYNIMSIEFEDINNKKLNYLPGNKFLLKNDEGIYLLKLKKDEYEDLKKGKFYIKIGIILED
jgi:hypothetical protein